MRLNSFSAREEIETPILSFLGIPRASSVEWDEFNFAIVQHNKHEATSERKSGKEYLISYATGSFK